MTDQHKKQFFQHWIAAYGNHLNEVARHKRTETKMAGDSLQEMPISASPAVGLQISHAASTETKAKFPHQ